MTEWRDWSQVGRWDSPRFPPLAVGSGGRTKTAVRELRFVTAAARGGRGGGRRKSHGLGRGGRPDPRSEKGARWATQCNWLGPVWDRKGLRFQVPARSVCALQSGPEGDTASSGPTTPTPLSLHYNEPLRAGTPPSETLCRRRVRTSLT